jgi:restriction system protein
MKNYYRIMLGAKSKYFEECYNNNFIGVDFGIKMDLSGKLPEDWRMFNKQFIPIYLDNRPGKTKVAAGLACATIWVIAKGIKKGDIVLCPNGQGSYCVGEITDEYSYIDADLLPHRRAVRWLNTNIDRNAMSDPLKNSTGAIATYCNVTKHSEEIERLLNSNAAPQIFSSDDTVEDPSVFALEKHLEDFLVANWKQTELALKYDIYEEDGEIGKQYPCDTGHIDIFAISKDKKELLVIELKKGRASDAVVGQIQRYMGYVKEELAEEGQTVKGIIIALEDDLKIKRALSVTNNIEFYRYQVSFKLFKN